MRYLVGDSTRNWSRKVYVALGQSALRAEAMSPQAQSLISQLHGRLRAIECPSDDVGDWQIQGFHLLVATIAYADVLASQLPDAADGAFEIVEELCSARLPTSLGEAGDLVCRQAAAQMRIGKLANEQVRNNLDSRAGAGGTLRVSGRSGAVTAHADATM